MEHGEEARNELVKLIAGKCVTINVYGMDQYGRHLGDIYCDGIFIQVRQKFLI
jgi:endonuclease YncB( thermonuclease family)